MSIRDAYEACLIELNKVQAPSLLLEDFVYLFNKAIQLYVNLKYNLFESNQQSTDDLRSLTNTIKIDKLKINDSGNSYDTSFDCILPEDYVHILNVICEFTDNKPKRCNNQKKIVIGANKLDSNKWPSVITNYYMKPSIKLPYYYIINLQDPELKYKYDTSLKNDKSEKDILSADYNREGFRYGNSKLPIMLIKCGNLGKDYTLDAVYVDYLRAPEYVYLDSFLLDEVLDKSQILEFSDYVIYEIINIFVKLVLENTKDTTRILTYPGINTTIPNLLGLPS